MDYFTGPETAAPNDQTFAKVIAPTAFALLLCNMDRIVMSVAILPIAKEFNWAPSMQVCSAPTSLPWESFFDTWPRYQDALNGLLQKKVKFLNGDPEYCLCRE